MIQPQVLSALLYVNVAKELKSYTKVDPMKSKNPTYFKNLLDAVSNGLAQSVTTIAFKTKDVGVAAAPLKIGKGTGIGIKVNESDLTQRLYTNTNKLMAEAFGESGNVPWKPKKGEQGYIWYLICKGIAKSIKTHFQLCWQLKGTHVPIYMGKADITKFYGLKPNMIAISIQNSGSLMRGKVWPKIAQAIALSFCDSIQKKATGVLVITGTCIPSQTQTCGIPMKGVGIGTAK